MRGTFAATGFASLCWLAFGCGATPDDAARVSLADKQHGGGGTNFQFANPSGKMETMWSGGAIGPSILNNPFFVSLGSNGRACVHCHLPGDGFAITPASVTWRFSHPLDVTSVNCLADVTQCAAEPNAANYGMDPIFRPVDGAVSPNADVSTAAARRVSYAMLLNKGLIRVGIGIPAGAEFTLAAVDDPYGYASASELSLFRRPLPSTNLRTAGGGNPHDPVPGTPVITAVMWDGRETIPGNDIIEDLLDQANGATLGHAQATAGLTTSQRQSIVAFETSLLTAQFYDNAAGTLTASRATGGPDSLSHQLFYVGINDVFAGDSQTNAPFNPNVFTMYSAWSNGSAAQQSVARGEALFNTKPIAISGVAGVNDVMNMPTINGSCSACHDAPSFGGHSVKLALDLGLTDASRRTPDLPLYTLQNIATGETRQTTDPGRALISGKWADIGKFKGPILRGVASRAPYFHNGSAATLNDVVNLYDTRFQIGFSAQEKADLVAFLQTL